ARDGQGRGHPFPPPPALRGDLPARRVLRVFHGPRARLHDRSDPDRSDVLARHRSDDLLRLHLLPLERARAVSRPPEGRPHQSDRLFERGAARLARAAVSAPAHRAHPGGADRFRLAVPGRGPLAVQEKSSSLRRLSREQDRERVVSAPFRRIRSGPAFAPFLVGGLVMKTVTKSLAFFAATAVLWLAAAAVTAQRYDGMLSERGYDEMRRLAQRLEATAQHAADQARHPDSSIYR